MRSDGISLREPQVLEGGQAFHQVPPTPSGSVRNSVGMQLRVAEENTQPTLSIVLPVIRPPIAPSRSPFRSTSQYDRAGAPTQISSTSGNRGNTASDRCGDGLSEPWRTRGTFQAPFICWREQPSKKMAFAFTS